jgi:hypothetical protein
VCSFGGFLIGRDSKMQLHGFIVWLLGLVFFFLAARQAVRASPVRMPAKACTVRASQVKTIRTFEPKSRTVSEGGTRIRALSTELLSAFSGAASRASNCFSATRIASHLLVPTGYANIGTTNPQSLLQVYNGEAQVGSSSNSCSASNAGAIRYASSTLYYCNGSGWQTLITGSGGLGSGVTLGTSASVTNPQRISEIATGFYSAGSGLVDVSSTGTQVAEFGSYGLDIVHGGLGIGTNAPDQLLSLASGSNRAIDIVRAASGSGNQLTVQAGGAVTSGTDLQGGDLILSGGISTGTGFSNVQIQTYPAASSTGSNDNTPVPILKMFATGSASSGQGTLNTFVKSTAGSGTDANGANLTLSSGISTGTGSSQMQFNVYGAGGSSNATANAAITAMTIASTGYVGIGTTGNANITAPLTLSGNMHFVGTTGGSGGLTGGVGGSNGQVEYNNGGAFGGAAGLSYATSGTNVQVASQHATDKPFVVIGTSSQSGDLTEWQNSSNTVLAKVDSSGDITTTGTLTVTAAPEPRRHLPRAASSSRARAVSTARTTASSTGTTAPTNSGLGRPRPTPRRLWMFIRPPRDFSRRA